MVQVWPPTSTDVADAWFDGTGSEVLDEAVAILMLAPAIVGVTTMMIVALAPLGRSPRLQLTVPDA